jgi:hypothetical protein
LEVAAEKRLADREVAAEKEAAELKIELEAAKERFVAAVMTASEEDIAELTPSERAMVKLEMERQNMSRGGEERAESAEHGRLAEDDARED